MDFNFGEILSRAWQIVWKHKVLWIFGFLASCGRGGSSFNSGGNSGGDGFGTAPDLPPQIERFLNVLIENTTTVIAISIALICIFWIVAVFLSTIGRIGLIRGTWQVEGGSDHLIFGQLFSESAPYFWRLFGLSLLVSLPFVILVAALVAAVIVFAISIGQGNDASAIGLLSSLPLLLACMCLLVPVGFVINMIIRQAERVIVLEGLQVMPALSRGWEIFRNNLGPIIVMAIILTVIGMVAAFVIAIPLLVVIVPAAIAFAAGDGQNFSPLLLALLCICLYAPVSWLLHGIMTAYTEAAWTLTYMRLTRRPDDDLPGTPLGHKIPPDIEDGNPTIISGSNA